MKRNKYMSPLAKIVEINTMTVIAADSIRIEDDGNRGGSTVGGGTVMSNKQQGTWGDVWSK